MVSSTTTWPSSPLFLLLLLLLQAFTMTVVVVTSQKTQHPTARSINILNESGRRVDIHWVNPDNGEMVLQTNPDILAGASQSLSSYVGHTFEVRELPAKKSGVCAGDGEVCRVDHFTVSSNNDQSECCIYYYYYLYVCTVTGKLRLL